MRYEANNPEEYISQLPIDRRVAIEKLRKIILDNISVGFQEIMSYGMISYVIPHSIYKAGNHVNPKEPVPYISIASQKNYIAFYHMGIYSNGDVLLWFQNEYPRHAKMKLDMGKGCIRFKHMDDIPYELLAELCRAITLENYLKNYEIQVKKAMDSRR